MGYIFFVTRIELWKRNANHVFKSFEFFLFKIIFFMFLDHLNMLISKIILKNKKKIYFNTFLDKK